MSVLEIEFGEQVLQIDLGEQTDLARQYAMDAKAEREATEAIINDFIATGTRSWYVSPSVHGATAGTGTLSDPFSFEHAGSGGSGTILPGHTVFLRGQRPGGPVVPNYRPYTGGGKSREQGYTLSVSGTPAAPIKWKNYPGEVATFADHIDTSAGWTKVTTQENGVTPLDPSVNVYESNFTVAGTSHFVGAYFVQNGDQHILGALRGPTGSGPYITSTNIGAMYATSSRFRMDGMYYPCPCIIRLGNGKLRTRLDPCYVETHENGVVSNPFFGETTQVYPASTNPALVDLRINRMDDTAVVITGNWNSWEGGSRASHGIVFEGFIRGGIKDQGNHNDISGCLFRSAYIPLVVEAIGATVAGNYYENTLDGMLDMRKSPIAWGDIKGGSEVLTNSRTHGFSVGNNASGGRAWANTIRRCYDGMLFNAPNWKIGGDAAPIDGINAMSAAGRALARWQHRNIFNVWDDALQLYATAQGLDLGFNMFAGAGPSRDGASSGTPKGANKIKVHHNVIDVANNTLIWSRRGRDYAALASSNNAASTTVAGSFTDADTSITVANGSVFSAVTFPRSMTILEGRAPWRRESVQVTARSGNTLTVVRGRAPTGTVTLDTAIPLLTGDIIVNALRDMRNSEEGRASPNAAPTHGIPTGGQTRFAWDFYQNTLIIGAVQSGHPNGFVSIFMMGTEATQTEPGQPKNLVFNNVLLSGGSFNLTAPTADPRTMNLSSTRVYTARGETVHDGNVYIGTAGYSLNLIQQLRTGTGVDFGNSINTIAEFRTPEMLADAAAAGYAPGMESQGLAYTDTLASQLDSGFHPIDPRLQTGAVNLTSMGLPGTEIYEPWRGALPPVGVA